MSEQSQLPQGAFNLPPGVSLNDIDPPDDCMTCGGEGVVEVEDAKGRVKEITCPDCKGFGFVED